MLNLQNKAQKNPFQILLVSSFIFLLGLSGIGYAANVQTWQQGWLPSNGIDGISMLDLGVKTGGSGKGTARGMVYAGNALYITNQSEGTIARCEVQSNGDRGTCVKNYIQGIQNPYSIAKSPDNKYLYVLSKGLTPDAGAQGGNTLYRFTISGWFTKLDPATAPKKPALPNAYQIAADSDGYVYIPDYLNKRIVRIRLNDDGTSTRGNYNISVAFPRGASIGEDGNLYVYNDAGQIAQLNKSNFTTVASYTGNFQDKFGLDVALRGIYAKNANEVWISNQGGSNGQNTIHKVSLTGQSLLAFNATSYTIKIAGIQASCEKTSVDNGSVTVGSPSFSNQGLQTSNAGNACYVSCNSGFQYNGSSKNCVALPTRYAGCGADDIIVGSYKVAACNVGSSVSGLGSDSYGRFFQAGRSKGWNPSGAVANYIDFASSSTVVNSTNFNIDGVFPENGNWISNPCASGYDIPSITDWQNIVSTITGKYSGYTDTDSNLVSTTLKLPFAGYRTNGAGTLQTAAGWGPGDFTNYWSKSSCSWADYPRMQAMFFSRIPKSPAPIYFDPGSSYDSGFPIRCIKAN